jgi:MFS family permease
VADGRSTTRWRGLDRRVWQLAIARAINTMGLSLAMTFVGIYVVETRGYPAWLYGLVAMTANLGQSLSSAWAGNLSDRIGRRPLITSSLFLRSVFIAALGTQVLFDAPLWSLALNLVASSSLRGCFEPVAYALVSDVVDADQRIAAFGLQRMGTNLGWAIGPALGGTLTLVVSYGVLFYVASAAMVIAAFITMFVADPIVRREGLSNDGHVLAMLAVAARQRTLRLLLLGTFLAAVVSAQTYATMSIYLTDTLSFAKADIGLIYALNGICVLVLQLPAVALVKRLGIGVILPWSSLLSAIGFSLVGLAVGLPGCAGAMIVITSAEVLFAPAHQAAIAEVADPEHRGQTYGVAGFAQMAGVAVAPLFGGVLLDLLGDHHVVTWAAIAAVGLLQMACFSAFVRTRQ